MSTPLNWFEQEHWLYPRPPHLTLVSDLTHAPVAEWANPQGHTTKLQCIVFLTEGLDLLIDQHTLSVLATRFQICHAVRIANIPGKDVDTMLYIKRPMNASHAQTSPVSSESSRMWCGSGSLPSYSCASMTEWRITRQPGSLGFKKPARRWMWRWGDWPTWGHSHGPEETTFG